jgi:hypothetical protein
MRIRQTKLPPVRSSLRELPRTAQVFIRHSLARRSLARRRGIFQTIPPGAGDTITVNLSNGTNPVTIIGPGVGTAGFTVHIEAFDNHGANAIPEDCGGTASAQIVHDFHGFFPPLSGQINTKVKQGSGIPVKFSITDCNGTPITTGDQTIDVTYLSGIVPTGDPTVDDAGQSGDNGINFRYDPVGMQWIFNLKTNSSYGVGDTYQIEVTWMMVRSTT